MPPASMSSTFAHRVAEISGSAIGNLYPSIKVCCGATARARNQRARWPKRAESGRRDAHYWRASRRAFAALRSAVSNPSVNRW
jgi:hypothetical protein